VVFCKEEKLQSRLGERFQLVSRGIRRDHTSKRLGVAHGLEMNQIGRHSFCQAAKPLAVDELLENPKFGL
jgi:hypothetical protein